MTITHYYASASDWHEKQATVHILHPVILFGINKMIFNWGLIYYSWRKYLPWKKEWEKTFPHLQYFISSIYRRLFIGLQTDMISGIP